MRTRGSWGGGGGGVIVGNKSYDACMVNYSFCTGLEITHLILPSWPAVILLIESSGGEGCMSVLLDHHYLSDLSRPSFTLLKRI